jgi:hypothetical protein
MRLFQTRGDSIGGAIRFGDCVIQTAAATAANSSDGPHAG